MFLTNRLHRWPAIGMVVAALAACGGKAPTPTQVPVLMGQFLDGPVQGLGFRTATQSGTTDAQGRFRYLAGESVTFSIGGLDLPPVRAASVVTPLEVAGTDRLEADAVVNLLVLLQSVDQNNNPTDGIVIPQSVSDAAVGAAGQVLGSALMNQGAVAFRTTLSGSSLLAGRQLVDQAQAVAHFAKTLMLQVPEREFETDAVVVARARALDQDGSGVQAGETLPVYIRFDGRNLNAPGLVPEVSGVCTTVQLIGEPTDKVAEFSCTPVGLGQLTVHLKLQGVVVGTFTGVVEPVVLMRTSLGDLTLELNRTKAPVTSDNFLRYVEDGYYTNTVFHRVISNFMVQGGGFVVSNNSLVPKGGTYDPIVLERTTVTGLSNTAGTLAMARTNAENSATSQFFINTVDNLFLDGTSGTAGYAVFGRVVSGGDTTLQALRAVPVQNNGATELSLPLTPPVILSAKRVR